MTILVRVLRLTYISLSVHCILVCSVTQAASDTGVRLKYEEKEVNPALLRYICNKKSERTTKSATCC